MTPDPLYQRLLEISWRRELTAAEAAELQALLAAHPELQKQWGEEANLNELLEALPVAPVPSNFTSRVLRELDRHTAVEARMPGRARWQFWNWRMPWLPRAGFAAIVLGSGVLAYHQHTIAVRQELGRDLAKLSEAGGMMPSEVLTNYDAIRLMTAVNEKPTADPEILRLLE